MCVHCQKLSVVFEDTDDKTCSKDDVESGICKTKLKNKDATMEEAFSLLKLVKIS